MSKDTQFLDNLQKVFEDNVTNLMFKSHLNKVNSALHEARRTVKKNNTKTNIRNQRNTEAKANKNENTSVLINIAQEDDSTIFLNCYKTCE